MSELKKLEDMTLKADPHAATTNNTLEKLLGHLCGQLSNYISARLKTVDLYPLTFINTFTIKASNSLKGLVAYDHNNISLFAPQKYKSLFPL